MNESAYDTARRVIERDAAGFVGPLTQDEWRALLMAQYQAQRAALSGLPVELSEYTKIRLGLFEVKRKK